MHAAYAAIPIDEYIEGDVTPCLILYAGEWKQDEVKMGDLLVCRARDMERAMHHAWATDAHSELSWLRYVPAINIVCSNFDCEYHLGGSDGEVISKLRRPGLCQSATCSI